MGKEMFENVLTLSFAQDVEKKAVALYLEYKPGIYHALHHHQSSLSCSAVPHVYYLIV